MMTDIDWSKAPEWAIGHGLLVQGAIKQVWYGEKAYMIVGDNRSYAYGGGDGETRHNHMPDAIQFRTLRPAPWVGKGLPPAGAVCEVQHDGRWYQATIIGIDPDDGDVVFKTHGDYATPYGVYDGLPAERFRPIRTPEQIAAEEREKVIDSMAVVADPSGGSPETCRLFCDRLYDAGYRKTEGGAQ